MAMICKAIEGYLAVPSPRPDEAVRLSGHLPYLLQVAAAQATAVLPSDRQHSGSSGGSSSGSRSAEALSVGTHYFYWREGVDAVTTVINALNAAHRLPQQQVADAFSSPGAGEQTQGHLEDPLLALTHAVG
jgi:hypothetical protein